MSLFRQWNNSETRSRVYLHLAIVAVTGDSPLASPNETVPNVQQFDFERSDDREQMLVLTGSVRNEREGRGDHRRRCRTVINRHNAFMSLTTVELLVPVALWPVTSQKRVGTDEILSANC